MSKKFYNICIIDDHQLIRDGVKLILKETSLYRLKSEFGDLDSFFLILNHLMRHGTYYYSILLCLVLTG